MATSKIVKFGLETRAIVLKNQCKSDYKIADIRTIESSRKISRGNVGNLFKTHNKVLKTTRCEEDATFHEQVLRQHLEVNAQLVRVSQKAWACFYGSDKLLQPQYEIIKNVSGAPLNPTDYQYRVNIHHGSICEEVAARLDEGKVKFWRGADALDSTSSLRSFIDNLSLIDVDIVDTSMGTRRKWVTTPAHYFSALLFAYVGLQKVQAGEWEHVVSRHRR